MNPVTSPYAVIEGRPMYRLRRYFPQRPASGPAAVLIPPLMMSAEVFDLDAEQGAVALLRNAGIDPWVIDFGSPATEENGWTRTLDDHVLAVSAVVDTIGKQTGREVHLVGYCQGGMFAYLTAAYRRGSGIASIVGIGSMVDWTAAGLPFGPRVANYLAETVREGAQITDTVLKTWWDLVDPVSMVRNRARSLRNRSAPTLSPAQERRRRFMAGEGRIGYPGPAASDLLRQFAIGNRLRNGGFVIGGRVYSMAESTCPILGVIGHRDQLAPAASVRGITHAARSAPVYEIGVDAGHYKMVSGGDAVRDTWPTIADWLRWHEGAGSRPEQIVEMATATAPVAGRKPGSKGALFAPPRLVRAGRIRPATRISLGLTWSRRASSRDCLLHAGRAYTESDMNGRIDAIVRALIAVGVTPGDRVGVVPGLRPGTLIAMAALSRLGAVAVLLPADQHLAAAAAHARVGTVVAGPMDIDRIGEHDFRLLVLADDESSESRKLLTHNEMYLDEIDSSLVRLPDWYAPNPGTADEPAVVLFSFATASPSGREARPEAEVFTNAQWAARAYAAVSVTSVDYRDTVYCTGALADSAVLAAAEAALVSGARIALASSQRSETIDDEIRLYGPSVVAGATNTPARVTSPVRGAMIRPE
ncbi:AMP-binding protein [Nocardia sp. NPDC057668]|uniref:AMP-binding protein n=1 Tax=Nocardia sp. NPDC057668 TaxID=3346202 RepID=UPI00366A6175